jgi:arylsulfatase
MADQFRADALGCVGGYAHTPNLDELGCKGCLLTEAFANSAECIPSRISLAVGLYPHLSIGAQICPHVLPHQECY